MKKDDKSRDHALGLDRPITRRDFLNGIAIGTAALACTDVPVPGLAAQPGASPARDADADAASAAQDAPGYYPPLLTGMRGSHPGSFEAAHALRDGKIPPAPTDTGERYDLIVVGGGISGLAAAHFYRAHKGPESRILILDNHDDFGGHAKRNEFHLGGRLHLLNGGTLEIDSPRPYGPVAAGLLKTLGIDVPKLAKSTQHLRFYEHLGLERAAFFDRETFGADQLVVGTDKATLARALAQAPLSARAREQIVQIETGEIDYLPGLSSDEKKQRLSRISYQAFLRDVVGVEPEVLKYYYATTMGEWGVGTDAVSALDCWGFGISGFQGMKLAKGSIARMGFTPKGYEDTGGSYRLHFPDGNASIARLLVRDLIPQSVAGASNPASAAEDIVTARIDYSQLDTAGRALRLRLNSTAVRVRHLGEPTAASEVEVSYVRAGKGYGVRARGVVLACYNMMIPYLCPELPAEQRRALHSLVKTPLVYTSVALRNWRAFDRLKVSFVYAPGSYHTYFHLNPHVTIGAYRGALSPEDPVLVHMVRTPCKAGLPEHDQNRAGRMELLTTSFETFERNIRDQLGRTLAGGGFDPARDITAITVNRWPHGYAPEYNPLFDPELPEPQQPHVVGRARFGRITIANSDAGGAAYTDSAINQGHRAVMELLAHSAA
ncbi:MAG TPA: FAD/NAD(P)-binding protein [Steroidobacteraceae bacterium]|nr:FAD/NAD(P)-binding protein [Steroidobacteraceae bacterium]